jgi:hypothetical protein
MIYLFLTSTTRLGLQYASRVVQFSVIGPKKKIPGIPFPYHILAA